MNQFSAIAIQEPENEKEKQPTLSETFGTIKKSWDSTKKEIQSIDIHFANWDALLIKSLLVINAKVVFILFVVLIIFVFQGKGSLVNATAAYQTIILALSGVAFGKINLKVNNLASPKEILQKSLLVCAFCALLQSCSQNYFFYLLMFIPFVLSRAFVEYYFKEVFETSKNQKLAQDLETITHITEIFGPLLVGLLFQLMKHNAYRLLAVSPFIVIYFVVSKKVYKEVRPEKLAEDSKGKSKSQTDKDK